MTEFLMGPLVVFGATLGTVLYVVHRYEADTIFDRKVVPKIIEACSPRDTEKLLKAYRDVIDIMKNSFTFSSGHDIKKKTDILEGYIRGIEHPSGVVCCYSE